MNDIHIIYLRGIEKGESVITLRTLNSSQVFWGVCILRNLFYVLLTSLY